MKLLVLGATGPTGRHLVDLALRSGDSATALVRNPAGLGDLADRVTRSPGTPPRAATSPPPLPDAT
ncbi:NAD(P)H-binding protein [Streptomyces sp. NPDC057623]|uniref:NAD(P)H-binding protein n=1 Tax=Streptomyces sp. NPDC057623 TaxID=3346187 RepID=UPI00369DE43D